MAVENTALQGLLFSMAVKNPLLEEARARARKERELLASFGVLSPAEGVSSCVCCLCAAWSALTVLGPLVTNVRVAMCWRCGSLV